MNNQNIILSIISFINIVILIIVYFSKKRIKTLETKRYSIILINTLMIPITELVTYALKNIGFDYTSYLYIFLNKFILAIYVTWTLIFLEYMTITVLNMDEEKLKRNQMDSIFFIINIFVILAVFFTKINFQVTGSLSIPTGISTMIVYLTAGLSNIFLIILILFNIKKANNKKFIPLYIMWFFIIIILIFQNLHPEYFLMTSLLVYTTFIMYFTIENPDVKMIQQLELAKEQADKANRAKTDFLSSMSHEIRTPLNAIVGFSDCIMDAKDLGEAKENAKDIVNASQTLLEIVNGILDISKIEAGKIEIVNSPYNANETFLELAKLITPKMNEKGLDFTYSIAPDLPKTLYGDHANLKKIVTNLLSNACKYTDKGYVHYEVNCINSKDVSKLIISVEDSGRGIKKENIDKMFTKFQRLEEDRNTTIEGTGLGLAITKQLVELMGGKIIVHTVYGEGSKFTVVINQRIEAVDLQEKSRVKTTLDLANVRILLVDDTALNLKVACKLLERYHANHIVTCESGFECIERIKRGEVYDLILLDDMMPKMSGVETLKKLKEIPGFRIPTIALTANAITGMREKYLNDGFDDYLAKPIEKEQLILVVNQILGRNVTEELDFSKEEKITNYMNGPVTSVIRGEEIPQVDDFDKADEERKKNDIIPVEDNIEETLGKTLDLSYEMKNVTLNPTPIQVDHIESLEEEVDGSKDVPAMDILPVVDIDLPTENLEKVDRKYLEDNGVDVDHALELLGDMDMYDMTISDFMSEVEDKWSHILEYKDSGNMPEYAILVHSLKSDCKYLGFMKLADISYQHELKSKENDSEFVNSHFSELEEEYKKVLEIARTYVEHHPVSE